MGIPYLDPAADIGNWLQPDGVAALIAEAAAFLLAGVALADRHRVSAAHVVAEARATIPGLAEAV